MYKCDSIHIVLVCCLLEVKFARRPVCWAAHCHGTLFLFKSPTESWWVVFSVY